MNVKYLYYLIKAMNINVTLSNDDDMFFSPCFYFEEMLII